MEYPQGSSGLGQAQCLILPNLPTPLDQPQSECENEVDYLNRPLGDANRLAVYQVSSDSAGMRNILTILFKGVENNLVCI